MTISATMIATTTISAARAFRTAGFRSAVRGSGVTSPRCLASSSAPSNYLAVRQEHGRHQHAELDNRISDVSSHQSPAPASG